MRLFLGVFIFSVAMGVYAAEAAKGAKIKVNGMVCSFCSTSIEKKFRENSEVSNVQVDLDKKIVSVQFVENKQLSDDKIKEIITKSGYNVVSIEKE